MTPFQRNVLECERRKLRAVQDKLPIAIAERNAALIIGLAQAAERIASRLVIMLDNLKKE